MGCRPLVIPVTLRAGARAAVCRDAEVLRPALSRHTMGDYCLMVPPHERCSRKCAVSSEFHGPPDAADLVPAVERAARMRHRGPDEAGTWNDADLVCGFNRLSIIDLAHCTNRLCGAPKTSPTVTPDVQRRDLQLRGAPRGTHRRRLHLQHVGRRRPIVVGFHHWAPTWSSTCAACSAWPSGTRSRRGCSSPATLRHQAAVLRDDGRARLRLGEEDHPEIPGTRRGRQDVDKRALVHYMDGMPEPESLHRHPPHGSAAATVSPAARSSRRATSTRTSPSARCPGRRAAVRPDRRSAGGPSPSTCADVTVLLPSRHRLHRHRDAGQAPQPESADLHHRLRARGLLRGRRRGGRRRSA